MAKTKQKTFTVTVVPPAGQKERLALRPTTPQSQMPKGQKASVQERTQLRYYHLPADTAEDARSLIEEHERKIVQQAVDRELAEADPNQEWEGPKRDAFRLAALRERKPWKVEKVKAD